jgi:hypothetical protein
MRRVRRHGPGEDESGSSDFMEHSNGQDGQPPIPARQAPTPWQQVTQLPKGTHTEGKNNPDIRMQPREDSMQSKPVMDDPDNPFQPIEGLPAESRTGSVNDRRPKIDPNPFRRVAYNPPPQDNRSIGDPRSIATASMANAMLRTI